MSGPIYNTNDDLIATDAADLWDGTIANPIAYNEFGAEITFKFEVWTGTAFSGIWQGDSCGNWDSTSSAAFGSVDQSTTLWVFSGSKTCTGSSRLYGISPEITLPDSADFNDDDVVDGLDFLTLQRGLGTVGPSATHANGDANGDDFINDADLAVWESQYGNAPPLSALGAVPEPTTSTLALVALCLVVGRRHSR